MTCSLSGPRSARLWWRRECRAFTSQRPDQVFFPKRFIRVGGTSEKKLRFVVNQKSLKAIGGKSEMSAHISGQFSSVCPFCSFHIVFTHTAYYFIRAILILPSITFWTPANLILPSITFWRPANEKSTKNQRNVNETSTNNQRKINESMKNQGNINETSTKNE